MGDGLAVERVVSNLNNSTFFGSKMQLGFSKQAFLADVQSPYQLPDGSNSFQGGDSKEMNFGLSVGLKNSSSFGLRFPYTKKTLKKRVV